MFWVILGAHDAKFVGRGLCSSKIMYTAKNKKNQPKKGRKMRFFPKKVILAHATIAKATAHLFKMGIFPVLRRASFFTKTRLNAAP
ncbi:MAG: hypothetical protein LBH44_01820 [Treponema sp.]|jgi:hypothetical protein|nr:hypothetical protein [Treponema sp.]